MQDTEVSVEQWDWKIGTPLLGGVDSLQKNDSNEYQTNGGYSNLLPALGFILHFYHKEKNTMKAERTKPWSAMCLRE